MNRTQLEDCQSIGKLDYINWEKLRNTTIIITGSTGLIGSNLVNALAYNNQEKKLNLKLFLPVRNVDVARDRFGWTKAEIIPYTIGTELKIEDSVDYIVHLASPTSSEFFKSNPVNTMLVNIEGTRALLDWAKAHQIKKFICLSSMEVYGFPEKGHKVKENELGAFETMHSRNSYPIAKIACEALCNSYFNQFGIPTVVLRATQTFGPGVRYDDKRVFAQFMRCAIEKKDIVLKTAGLTERSYLYTGDAVSAIIVAMLDAVAGEAYTVANPDTYCNIKTMAQIVADEVASGRIKVQFDMVDDIKQLGYADTLYMDLDINKIKSLGWKPTIGLINMFRRMIQGLEEDER